MLFSDIESFVKEAMARDEDVVKTAAIPDEAEVVKRLDDVLVKQAELDKRAYALRLGKLLVALDVLNN